MRLILFLGLAILGLWAHGVDYEIKKTGMAISLSSGPKIPASYASYKLYAPHASLPFQEGNADKNGVVAFVPDRAGIWRLKASIGSDHGAHAVDIEFEINEEDKVVWIAKPLFARYSAIITGVSLLIGFLGLMLALNARQKMKK
jgi:nickel transport protein